MVEKKSTAVRLSELGTKVGRTVRIEGEIAQIKQTSGPTIFTIVDESGTENAAAFIEAGVRAYPEAELGDLVRIVGEVMMRNNQLQIEVSSLSILTGEERAESVRERIEKALDLRSGPPKSPSCTKRVMEKNSGRHEEYRKNHQGKRVFTSQPILLRHHADADGICSAVAIEQAGNFVNQGIGWRLRRRLLLLHGHPQRRRSMRSKISRGTLISH